MPETARALSTVSFGIRSTDMIVKLSWDGKMIATFGLELLPDNRRVFRSIFLLKDIFTMKPINIAHNKILSYGRQGHHYLRGRILLCQRHTAPIPCLQTPLNEAKADHLFHRLDSQQSGGDKENSKNKSEKHIYSHCSQVTLVSMTCLFYDHIRNPNMFSGFRNSHVTSYPIS